MATGELDIEKPRSDANRRWWALAGIAGLFVILNQNDSMKQYWPIFACIGLAIIFNFIITILNFYKKQSKILFYTEILIDLLLINGIVLFTGGLLKSPFFFLFPLFMLVRAFHLNTSETVVEGMGELASCTLLILFEPRPEQYLALILDRFLILFGVIIATTFLVSLQARKQNLVALRLSDKECQLDEVCKQNKRMELQIDTSTQELEKANILLVKKNLALMAFHEIYTAMSSTYNSNRLLNLVMDTAMSLLKANAGFLMLMDTTTNKLNVRVSRGLPSRMVRSLQFKVGEGVEGEVARSGKAQLLEEIDQFSEKSPINEDTQSKIVVPLKCKNKVVGVITVESSASRAFSKNDLELFSTLGSQASEVLQNIEMYEELRTKADHLALLFEVGKNIGAIFNLRKLFETILERAMQVMKARRGFLLIYDRERNELIVRASLGLMDAMDCKPISTQQGIAGWVFEKVRPLLIPVVNKSPLFDPENDVIYAANRDLMVCPLQIRKKVFGVICLNDRIGGKNFTSEDLELLGALASQAAIAIENVELYASIRRDYLNAIKALAAAVDAKDHYTHGHSHKVMIYATLIAKSLNLSEKEIEKIKYGALLHDVGKIGISEAVLNKPSKLTPKEFDTIAMHPILGVSIVQNIESLKDLIPTILYHHERYSGGGYPEGKSGNGIPLGARIVTIADAWDVMTSDRAYRKALPINVAVTELKKCAGSQFDPEIVEAFINALEKDEKLDMFKEEKPDLFWDEEEISRLMD